MKKDTILKPLMRKLAIAEARFKEATRKKQLAPTLIARHMAEVDEAEALGRYDELNEMIKEVKRL